MSNNTIEDIQTLPSGTVVKVNGIPLVLRDNTRVTGHPSNLSAMFVESPKAGREEGDHTNLKED